MMKRHFILISTFLIAGISNAQDSAKPRANIAVSGCLMREGYGTIVVTNTNLDAIGDAAATAVPGGGKPPAAGSPPKWVLDHPGQAGQHVGEKVQIIGVSQWVDNTKGGSQALSTDDIPSAPRIEVQSFKVLTGSCF